MKKETKKVSIYTDGSSFANPIGPCAYSYVSIDCQGNVREHSQGEPTGTSNHAELMAAITALKQHLEYDDVHVFSDSTYVVNCINAGWYQKWLTNGWRNSARKPVANKELWVELLALLPNFKSFKFTHVRAHSGNEYNERADLLANLEMQRQRVLLDAKSEVDD